MDTKMIRFIDSSYNELFTIPDGGSIVVTAPNGEQYVGVCKYLDEMHVDVNGRCYHICEFAEVLARNGSKVEPETEPEMVGSYCITHRIAIGNKVYIMGHSPNAAQPYATWQAYRDFPDRDWGYPNINKIQTIENNDKNTMTYNYNSLDFIITT